MPMQSLMATYAIGGTVVAVLCLHIRRTLDFVRGDLYCLLLADWITGWMKSRMPGKRIQSRGQGVLKKTGYWIMVMVAFGAGAVFIEIGKAIGVNLGITTLLGWFVLASLIINEIRSILENFVEAGYNVPAILTKGLQVGRQHRE